MSRIDNTVNERLTPADTALRQESQQVVSSAHKQAGLAVRKVAIVHDWLVGGGAERVVEALHKLYPEAPIYTSYATEEWLGKLDGKVVTGYLQHLGRFRKFVPFLRGLWFSHLNLKGFDLVISSSGAEAKFVKTQKPATHINYCHAPTHYYWDKYDDYVRHPGFPAGFNWLARLGLKLLVGPLRRWDYKAAQRPDVLIANSSFTQTKIKQYYGRDSEIIHPPVDVERFSKLPEAARKGFVVVGRQTPYKKFELAVAACTKLSLPLTVIGDGPAHKDLTKLAGPSVQFVTKATDAQVAEHLAGAEALLFTGAEDFGISAVEALATGTPVIAYKDGGALDYVVEGKTGMFFEAAYADSLAATLQKFSAQTFDHDYIKSQAKQFSPEAFQQKITALLTNVKK